MCSFLLAMLIMCFVTPLLMMCALIVISAILFFPYFIFIVIRVIRGLR